MFFDVVLADEVWDVGWVVDRVGAVPVDGCVDEVGYVVCEGGVDEGFSLGFFGLGRRAGAHGGLHAEDAPDLGRDGFEDGGAVVEVALHKFDGIAFLGQGYC